MKGIFLILTFFLFSCQTLPLINPPVSLSEEKSLTCPSPFLKQKYRLIHSIEARLNGNAQSAVIGINLADPSTRVVSCAILTAEGMVLLEAESDSGRVVIKRALPPFDSENFAKNMIEDIKLIFFPSEGHHYQKGYLPDGSKVCRYRQDDGGWVDVIADKMEGTEIKRYSSSGSLKRRILYDKATKNIYQRIELQAYETFDYFLLMKLIEAQPVKTKEVKRR
ncbi:MAG: hypothetical protein JW976_10270 [Syntrophaceae bacterium]|nr:hypothetical protein [Syntrophaceae bacterium]